MLRAATIVVRRGPARAGQFDWPPIDRLPNAAAGVVVVETRRIHRCAVRTSLREPAAREAPGWAVQASGCFEKKGNDTRRVIQFITDEIAWSKPASRPCGRGRHAGLVDQKRGPTMAWPFSIFTIREWGGGGWFEQDGMVSNRGAPFGGCKCIRKAARGRRIHTPMVSATTNGKKKRTSRRTRGSGRTAPAESM